MAALLLWSRLASIILASSIAVHRLPISHRSPLKDFAFTFGGSVTDANAVGAAIRDHSD
jgi:hypothetical protein